MFLQPVKLENNLTEANRKKPHIPLTFFFLYYGFYVMGALIVKGLTEIITEFASFPSKT